jgi:predicted nucleic acid-binding protein
MTSVSVRLVVAATLLVCSTLGTATPKKATTPVDLPADAQIVALCLEHGVRDILTEDRDFGRFPQISLRSLRQ